MPFILPYLHIEMPGWVGPFLERYPDPVDTPGKRMEVAIGLSLENVKRTNVSGQPGGPFGAVVFDEAGCLVAPGVNRVMAENNSVLHAEIVALMLAQKKLGTFDLSFGGTRSLSLYTSTEPCAMCFGAVCWSGIGHLVCGAASRDAEAVGFDEGPRHPDWIRELEARGIRVATGLCRKEAAAVLRTYVAEGGIIYNAGGPPANRG